jgi:hypothetical protein
MRKMTKRVLLALVGLALLLGVGSAVPAQGVGANDFSLAVAESTATVVQGHETQYHLTITKGNKFTAGVNMAVSGLPSGATGVWTPSLNTATSRVLTVYTTVLTQTGTFAVTFTGTSGTLTHSVTSTLIVQKAPSPGFTLDVSPSNLNVTGGTSGSFAVTINRTLFASGINFAVTGVPASSTATFDPAFTAGNTTTLNVVTSLSTPQGAYDLVIKGTSGLFSATTTAHLTVSAGQGKDFAIAGSLDRTLSPGVTGFLDLALTNPNNQPINITNLTVSITGTSKPGCTPSNFSVTQFSGTYPVTVPPNSVRTLSQLGVAQAQRPRVAMIDLPVNQDICKSTKLTLSYSGTGTGG